MMKILPNVIYEDPLIKHRILSSTKEVATYWDGKHNFKDRNRYPFGRSMRIAHARISA